MNDAITNGLPGQGPGESGHRDAHPIQIQAIGDRIMPAELPDGGQAEAPGDEGAADAGHEGHGSADTFRHSYSADSATLIRRLRRIEGQVRGISRMIEREEYCVDILQQTAALRAAIESVSLLILEDHVQGCVRTAAERGEVDKYVDEVLDVVRRSLGRPVRAGRSS